MDALTVYQKLKEAAQALVEYQKTNPTKSMWDSDIEKEAQIITERKHMLASSGQTCPKCAGSGRI